MTPGIGSTGATSRRVAHRGPGPQEGGADRRVAAGHRGEAA